MYVTVKHIHAMDGFGTSRVHGARQSRSTFDLEDTSNAPALTLHRPNATTRANT
jgi:hypothetical protein